MAISSAFRQRLGAVVQEFRHELAGSGHGSLKELRFSELEEGACEIGDGLATALIEAVLAEGAATACEPMACCPHCQRAAPREGEPEPRLVATRRGEVAWPEPKYYCRHCRQAFFPSQPRAGN